MRMKNKILQARSLFVRQTTVFWVLLLFLPNRIQAREAPPHKANEILNPYYRGCFYEKLPGWDKLRACTSTDPPDAADRGYCERNEALDYLEIRLGAGNWDSATAVTWLLQIVLTELLGVPTTVESGTYDTSRDFYDAAGRIGTLVFQIYRIVI